MASRKKRTLIGFLLLVCIFFAVCLWEAPRFLLYASDVKKADAVVLLLGPDFKARQKKAEELLAQGLADFLIIPAYHKITCAHGEEPAQPAVLAESGTSPEKRRLYPEYYEDTHLELIEAGEIMSRYGLTSAIFVSSPYHMRRIKIMVTKLFGDKQNEFYFIPTPYEKAPANIWEFTPSEWKKLRREYGKILWFLIYSTFPRPSAN
jgi:hypothetical protein